MPDAPDIPEELLQTIFTKLQLSGPFDDPISRRTLAALCRVNKQCCRLARPILYHTVYLSDHDGTIRRLWETLVQSPRLARLVKSMHVQHWDFPKLAPAFTEEQVTSELGQYESEVNDHIQNAVRDSMEPLRLTLGDWYDKVVSRQLSGIKDAMLVYLLLRCEHLQYLDMTMPFEFEQYSYVYFTLRQMCQRPNAEDPSPDRQSTVLSLSQLRELRMEHWDTEDAFAASSATDLWTLPSLKIFTGHMMDCTNISADGTLPANGLRELHLTYSLIEAADIQALLQSSPQLEVLSIEWGNATVGTCEIDYQEIGDVFRDLSKIAKKLKKLTLDQGDAFSLEYSEEDYIPPLGDLKILESLEELTLTVEALIGEDDEELDDYPNFEEISLPDVLPVSLRRLYILPGRETQHEEMGDQLLGLMEDPRFRSLSTITMQHEITEGAAENVGWRLVGRDYLDGFVVKRN